MKTVDLLVPVLRSSTRVYLKCRIIDRQMFSYILGTETESTQQILLRKLIFVRNVTVFRLDIMPSLCCSKLHNYIHLSNGW